MLPETIVDDAIESAWALVQKIGERTPGEPGFTRASFGAGEQVAADLVTEHFASCGIAADHDEFGNLYFSIEGTEPDLPAVVSGSHLDSVPNGGNYDGLAGLAASLAVLTAAKRAGFQPKRRMTVLATRGEESPWFNLAYLGSRLLLAYGDRNEIGARRRFDTGRTLKEHVQELGFPFRTDAQPVLSKENVACFLEVHIEQGPQLIEREAQLGIATAIRGNFRFPDARCIGAYGHASTTIRSSRQDAVMAVAELALTMDDLWEALAAEGDESCVVTFGRFYTDPAHHGLTKVPGEVNFSVNIGSTREASLEKARARLFEAVESIQTRRRVRFELGAEVVAEPVALDPALTDRLAADARELGMEPPRFSTAGHDAGIFALSGIPTAMILLRNHNGGHNPREHLEPEVFASGCRVLARTMTALAL